MTYPPSLSQSATALGSVEVARFLADRRLAGLAQHLVDFVDMRFFLRNQVARVLFERNGPAFDELQQLRVQTERVVLGLQGFSENLPDVVRVRLEQVADRERRVPAEPRDHLAGLLRVL